MKTSVARGWADGDLPELGYLEIFALLLIFLPRGCSRQSATFFEGVGPAISLAAILLRSSYYFSYGSSKAKGSAGISGRSIDHVVNRARRG